MESYPADELCGSFRGIFPWEYSRQGMIGLEGDLRYSESGLGPAWRGGRSVGRGDLAEECHGTMELTAESKGVERVGKGQSAGDGRRSVGLSPRRRW